MAEEKRVSMRSHWGLVEIFGTTDDTVHSMNINLWNAYGSGKERMDGHLQAYSGGGIPEAALDFLSAAIAAFRGKEPVPVYEPEETPGAVVAPRPPRFATTPTGNLVDQREADLVNRAERIIRAEDHLGQLQPGVAHTNLAPGGRNLRNFGQ